MSDEWPPRFNLGLGISPDVSFVEMSALTRPGYKLALEAELRLARRLSLASGVVYTQMRYQTDPEDYRAPYYGFWPQGSKPWGMASGDCQVIEVPINLRYALLAQPRQRFFVGAGVSSYFLLKEDYRFSMLNQTNQRQWNWHWGVENQNRHWFGILNLSAGYTRQLTGRWAVQAEPFIKLPLANGVGAGQLGLRSTGVFFSLRYQLLR
ncbi:MAG: hypothetical protein MUC97_11215 [Bernardetiaceae bacterium]|nr:hypothetical protein [Bernardetiaceae bacterium]